ncbi:MAG: hypothetical protein A2309_13520 [Bacteroidetes bacterium RIFOXYB2_FULL_35_7]|nr:MAG: hypothetical protein A2X01_04575 [Bacteroidetes bacterium GWF2_35_48]OFY92239.1 MAG: hypothetical protein A2309_13520 [Bacteroidetes bacterium RIFOXYB2_FULL_35_7]OFY95785.1 MAG: hypothetical protein A2491_15845 [Bacteroidetes bacterium RIFOXYC12_FULL_35_7]HBX50967.1 hypothetical protein [Bacteroidales bacterium]
MESAILISESKTDLSLLLTLAKKLGIGIHRLTTEEIEDMSLINAMKTGRTGEYIDADKYLKKLRRK